MKTTTSLVLILGLAIFFSFAATNTSAQFQAKLLTVDSVNDSHDASPGDSVCADENGQCSLRAAIEETNSSGSQSEVVNFALPDPSVIDLTLGELVITGNVYIAGPGARRLTVQRSYAPETSKFRIFHLTGNFGQQILISGIKIQNGNTEDDGGGIKIDSVAWLKLIEVWLTGNRAQAGGGIAISGRLTMTGSLVSSNTAELRSTKGKGGGVEILSGGGVSIDNSTITLNSANTSGAIDDSGWVELVNATIAQNFASAECTSICTHGHWIRILNTIIGPDLEAPERNALSGDFFTNGHNIVTDARGTTGLVNGDNYDQISDSNVIDPRLGELANNGGQTDTLAILDQSPAINAGDTCVIDNYCLFRLWRDLHSDQRARYSRLREVNLNDRVDVGAFQHGSTEINETWTFPWKLYYAVPGSGPGLMGILTDPETNQKYYFRVNNFGYMNFTNLPNRVYIFEIRSKVFGTGITEFYFPFPGVLDLRGSLRTNLTSGIGATVIEPKGQIQTKSIVQKPVRNRRRI